MIVLFHSMFLADELNKRQDTFKSLLCESKHHWLNQYFESVSVTYSLSHFICSSDLFFYFF